MTSERVAYAISSGCYSDYNVEIIFARREDAEAEILRRYEEYARDLESMVQKKNFEDWRNNEFYGLRIEEFEWVPGGETPLSLLVEGS